MLLRVLLFIQLVYVVNQVHFHFSTGIPGVAPANILMLLIFIVTLGKPDALAKSPPMLQKPFLYFFAAITFSFLWGQIRLPTDFMEDLTYYKNALFFPLFYFIYLRCRQDEKTTRQLIICIMFVAAVAGVEAIKEGLAYGIGKYNPMHRASGPFGDDWHNANRAGVFYAMFMPMFVSLALFLKHKKLWRLMAIGGAVLMAGGALFTYSRQAYFIILLGGAILLFRKSVVLAVVIGVVLVSAVGFLPDSVTQRVDETATQGKHGEEEIDASTASRWEIWEGAMRMLAEHPIGVGLHKFPHEIGNYSDHKGMDAHNFYVLTLAESGPIGLITLLYLFGTIFFRLAKFLRQHTPPGDAETNALTIGFTVCTICMGLGGIYGSPFFEGAVMAPYWALCGLLERYIQLKMENVAAEPAAPPVVEATLVEKFPLAAHLPSARPRR
jgi:O-antigen ligase